MSSSVEQWVEDVARTTRPKRIVWCDGSEAENERLIDEMVVGRDPAALERGRTRIATYTAAIRRTSHESSI